jgi:hypothetical protein
MSFQKLQSLICCSYRSIPVGFPCHCFPCVRCDTEAVPPPAMTPLVIVGSAIWMSASFSIVRPNVAALEVDHLLCFSLLYHTDFFLMKYHTDFSSRTLL